MRQRNAVFSELSRTFLYTFFSLPGRIDELATLQNYFGESVMWRRRHYSWSGGNQGGIMYREMISLEKFVT
jgi:hypothetical protein